MIYKSSDVLPEHVVRASQQLSDQMRKKRLDMTVSVNKKMRENIDRQKYMGDNNNDETYIYESPDGGKTVYRRKLNETHRERVDFSHCPTPSNEVNHPTHYNAGKLEAIDVIEDAGFGEGFCLGNAIKYILRANHKDNYVDDLRKAAWYINYVIEKEEKKS